MEEAGLKIVADENIPYVREAFAALGEVSVFPGRSISQGVVKDAEVLLVRSITKVDRALLEGSSVRFVATATIGEDHVDTKYLAERGIGFSSAPGCNANSVAEYIAAALLEVEQRLRISLRGKKLGIIGVGNVGSRVLGKAAALGIECVLNDPPQARTTGDPKYRPIEDVFDCDFVTLHVPLTRDGPDATYHLVDEAFMRKLKPGTVLINTARGAVIDTPSVMSALDCGLLRACVLDVWEGEPRPDPGMVDRAFIGTSHIAGYSFDGKVNGTRQIYDAACRFFGRPSEWDPSPLLPRPECPEIVMRGDAERAVYEAVRAVYDIMQDDAALRAILHVPDTDRGAFFDRLRKYYPRRREFFNTRVVVKPPNPTLTTALKGLGFQCQEK